MSNPNNNRKHANRRDVQFNWAGAIAAAVAGVATLAIGYLIGREELQQQSAQQVHQQRYTQYNNNSSTLGNPAEIDEPTDNESDACKICYDNLACAVTLNCRHQAMCMTCARQVTRCPICQSPVEKVIRVFKS